MLAAMDGQYQLMVRLLYGTGMRLLSVLWRAHLSSHDMFRRVDLGVRAARLREIIESGTPSDSAEFSIALSAFTVHGKFPRLALQ